MTKKFIAIILSAAMVASCSSALAADYLDVSKSAWYYDYVNRISELKAFSGYEDGTFRPDNQITQEEFLKTVVCLISGELTEDNMAETRNPWGDRWDAWALPYLDKACELGLVTAEDTMFKYVGIPCSRGEMARLVTRAFEYLREEPVSDTSAYVGKLKDYASTDKEYQPYVLQAYAKGIISGYEDGTFRDSGFLTRAEASSVLVRLVDKDARITETEESEKLYDFFGRQVSWTEPLRTDVPKQYQLSLSDLDMPQSSVDACIASGVGIDKQALNRSKAMMFEDLVLQSITYEGDTIKLTIPDYLLQNQTWKVNVLYWDKSEGYDYTNRKTAQFTKPGEYTVSDVKVLDMIEIFVLPINDSDYVTSEIFIINRDKSGGLDRLEAPEVGFNNLREQMVWVQGQGYKEYIKGYTGKVDFELEW